MGESKGIDMKLKGRISCIYGESMLGELMRRQKSKIKNLSARPKTYIIL